MMAFCHQPARTAHRRPAVLPALLIVLSLQAAVSASVALDLPRKTTVMPEPTPILWTTGAGKWVGYWGRRERVFCPADGKLEGAWGTDVYTDDSSICTAAVHAGLLSVKQGGAVTIEMRPDVGQYSGTMRNGVRTGDWMEPWTGAYVFVRNRTAAEPAIAAGSHMQADSWSGQAGRIVTFACSPNFELHTVYGTDVYTDDSYVCSAAVHRGLITQKTGGMVSIQLLEGDRTFTASSRNGVTSLPQESWAGQSYIFVATPPGTPPPPNPDTPYDRAPVGGGHPDSGAQL
ncbi:LCCL domain-containing protein [Nitrospira moscoviensis]|uniref:LCCL domain-containing protein n=1 Tax=Nitrospira moscoviensis TaxID=42253 RepID=A0A0K2GHQ8_NITMO|nr:LCCL domain-containing protein [Nitrospira moscoviensis]ALA60480.1 exported protein of unknown function [Nitrospira moscoviensis]